ncbi:MAG: 4-demethylwyosine synthase TYW1 [archaeon]
MADHDKDNTVEARSLFLKQHYGLVGAHSACKVCEWTKKSLRDEGVCYKEKFYGKIHGIRSHRCLQMTPAAYFCTNRCVYCWRAIEKTSANSMDGVRIDEPREIADGCVAVQRKLLAGFKGFSGTNMKKFREAQDPQNVAISLTGEPTLYPKISELIAEFKRRKMSVFLVTNGQRPDALVDMDEPSQFYLSLDAPTKEIYKRIDAPELPDYWERFNRTIDMMPSLSCKKAVRLTVVKGWNDSHLEEYAELIRRSDADFVEVKAYMWIGFSRKRLTQEAMPLHDEIFEFARRLNELISYEYRDEDVRSRVALLGKK